MPNCIIVPHIASASVATRPECASWPWPTWSPGSPAEDAGLRQPRGLRGASPLRRTWSSELRIPRDQQGRTLRQPPTIRSGRHADHVLERPAELGGWLDHPQPVTLLLDAPCSHRLDSPAEPWASHYARRLVSAPPAMTSDAVMTVVVFAGGDLVLADVLEDLPARRW